MARLETKTEKERGLSSFWIRIIAIASMIMCFISSSSKLPLGNRAIADCMYWFSFTLFAFLLVEGINNTTNRILYIRRFAFFTIISEFLYDWYKTGNFFDMKQQSVMVTLFILLLVMLFLDYIKRRFRNTVLDIILIVVLTIATINGCLYINSEFGRYGVLITMLFYTCHDITYPRIFEFAVMVFYSFYAKIDTIITVTVNELQYTVPITVFAIFALAVTWFYSKERGPNKLWLKIYFYIVYPLLLVIFGVLENLI